MHVLREGGEYLGRRERQLWWYFVGGSVAMILFSLALALRQLLAVVAIPVAFVLANAAVDGLQAWLDPRQGEGREFLRHASEVKNIWIPYGE